MAEASKPDIVQKRINRKSPLHLLSAVPKIKTCRGKFFAPLKIKTADRIPQ